MTEQVRYRIDAALVRDAGKVFDSIGLSPSAAVSVFFAQCVKAGGLPFRPGEEPAKRPAKAEKSKDAAGEAAAGVEIQGAEAPRG